MTLDKARLGVGRGFDFAYSPSNEAFLSAELARLAAELSFEENMRVRRLERPGFLGAL